MRILVTGTSGQLAQSLLAAGLASDVDVVALRRPQLDLTLPGTLRTALGDVMPDVVVNAGAYTAVDGEKTLMQPGDFVITPGWTWHHHGNDGSG